MSTERKVVRKFQLDYDVNDDIEQGRRRLFSVRWWLFSGHEMTPFSNKITYEKGRKVLQAIIFSSLGRHRELDIRLKITTSYFYELFSTFSFFFLLLFSFLIFLFSIFFLFIDIPLHFFSLSCKYRVIIILYITYRIRIHE